MKTSNYHKSPIKKLLDIIISLFGLLITSPLILFIALVIKITSKGSVIFLQKRIGKNGKVFKIIKFRTMIPNAERIQSKLKNLNQADGPVFKIHDDPRFTKTGKFLSRTGLDELPQLINVLRGEMSIVGPRPFPVKEAYRLSKEQKKRELINPGITSSWVTNGSHKLSFKKWMHLDKEYVENASFITDLSTIWSTIILIGGFILKL